MTGQTIATLRVKHPGNPETVFTILDGQTLRIGRDEASDIIVPDPVASRMHATVTASKNGVVIADCSSLNGTYVNGCQLQTMKDLGSGDVIDIGSTKISVELKSESLINSLSSKGASRAMTAQMRPIAVTVLVATVHDYYRLSETAPVDAVVKMLVAWGAEVRSIIERNQGMLDKTIEASLVAVWSGNEREQQAIQAVYSLQQILNCTQRMIRAGAWKYQSEAPWNVTVALSSGHGLQGALGAASAQSGSGFTIVGDPVNEAFQLQAILDRLETNNVVSADTARMASTLFSFRKHESVALAEQQSTVVYSLSER